MHMSIFRSTLLCIASVVGLLGSQPGLAADEAVLRGKITGIHGKPLYGIVVTAREAKKTYSTSVFTDDTGAYLFPPLEAGTYQVWAQATGFERLSTSLKLGGAPVQQDFRLNELKDIERQLTGNEWIASLPEDTPANHRMKLIFRNNCAGCHIPNFVLQNRFDEDGWRKIVKTMETLSIVGERPQPDTPPAPLIRQYREELTAYLAKMRGPGPLPMKLKLQPRPRGAAARVVITEYDYVSGLNGERVTADGSNWMEGIPSVYEARGPHDVEPDPFGYVWVADSQNDSLRTIARLDAKTGEVRNYRVPGRPGMARGAHGLVVDKNGSAWIDAGGGLLGVDPKADRVTYYEPPPGVGRIGGTLDADNDGVIWASSNEGAVKLDPSTGKFTDYKHSVRGTLGMTYGIAVDSVGNAWWAQMAIDKMVIGDGRTGRVTELTLPPVKKWDHLLTQRDRKLFTEIGSWWNTATLWAQGPRRLGAERNGRYVWVANYWGNNLGRIDIHSHEIKYFDYPDQSAFPGIYDTTVDKHGIVWIAMMNSDTVAKFDPKTEQWTEYRVPSLGTEARFIAVDNNKDPVEVWMPSYRTNKIMRLQFREASDPALHARKSVQ